MTKYEELIYELERNEKAFEESCQDEPKYDYVEVMNDSYRRILDLLPFKDFKEIDKYQSMAETFMDYDTFKNETLRIGSRLKEEKQYG